MEEWVRYGGVRHGLIWRGSGGVGEGAVWFGGMASDRVGLVQGSV